MLDTVLSKSKSKPSITADPKGRISPEVSGPNHDQRLFAAVVAACVDVKPPSVYVAPPTDSIIVLPYVF